MIYARVLELADKHGLEPCARKERGSSTLPSGTVIYLKKIMKKILPFIIILILVACGYVYYFFNVKDKNNVEEKQTTESAKKIGLANPSSVNCIDKGGTLNILKKDDGGEYGVCVFEDNKQCEEWALFYGFCPVGGVMVTGYNSKESKYCAIIGGEYKEKDSLCVFNNGAECDVKELYTGDCKQHFNEPVAKWVYKLYADPNILIGYPADKVKLEDKKDTNGLFLSVNITDISSLSDSPAPLGMDKETLEKDAKELEAGELIPSSDFGSNERLVKIGDINAKEYEIFSQFEVCSVMFNRVLVFYRNGYQIKLTLTSYDKKKIIEENPKYFIVDNANCGSSKIWNFKKEGITKTFYDNLSKGNIKGTADEWFNTFDLIKESVVIRK